MAAIAPQSVWWMINTSRVDSSGTSCIGTWGGGSTACYGLHPDMLQRVLLHYIGWVLSMLLGR
jgi:hypothetical protein